MKSLVIKHHNPERMSHEPGLEDEEEQVVVDDDLDCNLFFDLELHVTIILIIYNYTFENTSLS